MNRIFQKHYRNDVISKLPHQLSIRVRYGSGNVSKELYSIILIQSIYRGHHCRKELSQILRRSRYISTYSIRKTLGSVLIYHIGWTRLLIQSILLIFFAVTVHFQAAYNSPKDLETNIAILKRAESLNREVIAKPQDLFNYLPDFIKIFHFNEITPSNYCYDMFLRQCVFNFTGFKSEHDFLIELANNCSGATNGSAYLDTGNRIIESIYLTQTRRKEIDCLNRIKQIDPYNGIGQNCVDDAKEETYFVNKECSMYIKNEQTQIDQALNCSKYVGFKYTEDFNRFVQPIRSGSLNAPIDVPLCRLKNLQKLGWLDYRTKEFCIVIGLFNKNGDGRISSYQECFYFGTGGRVSYDRIVLSTSLMINVSVPMGLSITTIILVTINQFYHLVNERKRPKKILDILRFLGFALIIAVCGLYFYQVASLQSLELGEINDVQLLENPLSYFHSYLKVYDATTKWVAQKTLASLGLIIMLFIELIFLDFHPTSAVVSKTLEKASSKLCSFGFIFIIVVTVYSFVGMLLFGRTRESFGTFAEAFNNMLLAAIGEIQTFEESIFLSTIDPTFSIVIQALFFWSYILLVTLLLMNILLSIVVGAYVGVVEINESNGPILPFFDTFFISCYFWFERLITFLPGKGTLKTKKQQLESLYVNGIEGESSTINLRFHLSKIFNRNSVIESLILKARLQTQFDKIHVKVHHLKGLNQNLGEFKGYMINLMEMSQDLLLRKHEVERKIVQEESLNRRSTTDESEG